MVILQTVLKQWDKSELTDYHIQDRLAIPSQFPVCFPPPAFANDQKVVIDHHKFGDFEADLIIFENEKTIRLNRFEVDLNEHTIQLTGSSIDQIKLIPSKWIRLVHLSRHRAFQKDHYFWLYEQLILNVVCSAQLDTKIFLHPSPFQTIEISELNQ